LYQYHLLRLLRSQDTLYAKTYKAAKTRFQTGETNQLEVVATETQWREIQNRRTVTERELQTAYLQLQAWLYAANTVVIDTNMALQRPYSQHDVNSQHVALAEEESRLSRTLTALEQAQLKSDWRVGVANQSIEQRFGFMYISGGLGIPIFNKPQKARIEAAKIAEVATETQLKAVQFQVENQQKVLRENLNQLQSTLQYYQQSALPQAELLLQTAYTQFRLGDIEYVELFQNTRQAWQIREAYLAEQLRFSLTVIELEKWQGVE